MRKPDHFTTHKITDPKITRDLLKAKARLEAVQSYATKNGLKLDDVRDAHEDAALKNLPPASEVGAVEMTVAVDFATGEIFFRL